MWALCALSDDQESTDDPPWAMLAGEALKLTVGGTVCSFTLTVTLAVAMPPGPVAVIV